MERRRRKNKRREIISYQDFGEKCFTWVKHIPRNSRNPCNRCHSNAFYGSNARLLYISFSLSLSLAPSFSLLFISFSFSLSLSLSLFPFLSFKNSLCLLFSSLLSLPPFSLSHFSLSLPPFFLSHSLRGVSVAHGNVSLSPRTELIRKRPVQRGRERRVGRKGGEVRKESGRGVDEVIWGRSVG
jgi:hypothetical protein